MVYCGKPSKGCSKCRERKVKDQKEPKCGQCEARRLQCPGYRNLVDLMFRDESSHIIKKATKPRLCKKSKCPGTSIRLAPDVTTGSNDSPLQPIQAQSTTASSTSPVLLNWAPTAISSSETSSSHPSLALLTPTSSHWNSLSGSELPDSDSDLHSSSDDDDWNFPSPDEGTWPRFSSASFPYAVPSSLEQRGLAYFFAQHVTSSDDTDSRPFDFVFDMWRPDCEARREKDGLMAAMVAVGLVGLANLTGCRETRDWARISYGAALHLTNRALRTPGEAVRDATLLSVLILSTYETMAGRTSQAMTAWQGHIDGASALAAMRGTDLFTSEARIRMLGTLSHTMFVKCVQMALPAPPFFVDLCSELQSKIPVDSSWAVRSSFFRILQLRHDINSGTLTDRCVIIEQLEAADQELCRLAEQMPQSWKPRTVRFSQGHGAAFGESCHVYNSSAHSSRWCQLCSMRMLIHETIFREAFRDMEGYDVESLPFKHRKQLSQSLHLLGKLRNEILAAVPQHLGVIGIRDTMTILERESQAVRIVKPRKCARPLALRQRPGSRSTPLPLQGTAFDPLGTRADPVQTNLESADENGVEQIMALAAAGDTIVWPLYVVGMSFSCTLEIKNSILASLIELHQDSGIKEAHSVAQMVAARELPEPWLGSTLEDALLC